MNDFPQTGRIVIASPTNAELLYDCAPANIKNKIYTTPFISDSKVFVVDLDELYIEPIKFSSSKKGINS